MEAYCLGLASAPHEGRNSEMFFRQLVESQNIAWQTSEQGDFPFFPAHYAVVAPASPPAVGSSFSSSSQSQVSEPAAAPQLCLKKVGFGCLMKLRTHVQAVFGPDYKTSACVLP